jgi:hypothetical protein
MFSCCGTSAISTILSLPLVMVKIIHSFEVYDIVHCNFLNIKHSDRLGN